MAHEITTEIIINSSPDYVWQELMNFNAFPDWNPFIKQLLVPDKLEVGAKLQVKLQLMNRKPQNFTPKIISLEPNKEFSWLGNLFVPKIFDGHHFFQLESVGNKTRFIQKEKFSGILAFIIKFITKDTFNSFNAMNELLKERVESRGL